MPRMDPDYPSLAVQAFDWFGAQVYTGLTRPTLERLVRNAYLKVHGEPGDEWFDKRDLDQLNKPLPKKPTKPSSEVQANNRRARRMQVVGERARGWEADALRKVALGQILYGLQQVLDERCQRRYISFKYILANPAARDSP